MEKEKKKPGTSNLPLRLFHWLTAFLQAIYCEDLDVEWRHSPSYDYLIYFSGECQCTEFTDIQSDWRVKLGHCILFSDLYQVAPSATSGSLKPDVIPLLRVPLLESLSTFDMDPRTTESTI